jgi:hypothetical protein
VDMEVAQNTRNDDEGIRIARGEQTLSPETVPVLLRVLVDGNQGVKSAACGLLFDFALVHASRQATIASAGGIPLLCQMVKDGVNYTEAINLLCSLVGNEKCAKFMLDEGILLPIIELLRSTWCPPPVAAQLLERLDPVANMASFQALVAADSIQVLVQLISMGDSCCRTTVSHLFTIISNSTHRYLTSTAVSNLVQLLATGTEGARQTAVTVLEVMTAGESNERRRSVAKGAGVNSGVLVEHGALPHLATLIVCGDECEQEAAVRLLAQCARRVTSQAVIEASTVPSLVEMLRTSTHNGMVSACEVLDNYVKLTGDKEALEQTDAVPLLLHLRVHGQSLRLIYAAIDVLNRLGYDVDIF